MNTYDIVVVGGGVFGITGAIELQQRGFKTALVDPGPLPHPLAASSDISKVVRMEYGADEQYMAMVEACMPLWRDWNIEFGVPLFHETGVTMFTRDAMTPGGFEYESFHMLRRRGHTPERLDADEISKRFPAWKRGTHIDGFFHSVGGFAESGRVVQSLVSKATSLGVDVHAGFAVASIESENDRVTGIKAADGAKLACDGVVVAAGAWTSSLVPDLASTLRVSGHPVFHVRSERDRQFRMGAFATFTADVAQTGWYGFPLHPTEGVIKVANHGVGEALHPDARRIIRPDDLAALRNFLTESFPDIAEAPVVYSRRCLYCDTVDEHFLIDSHPRISGLVVAAGGSGHGFKFAPVLGGIIADAVERTPNHWLERFSWRTPEISTGYGDAARFRG